MESALKLEMVMETFYEKYLLLSKLSIKYYPEPDTRIRNKIKVELDLSNYDTKKN